MSREKFIQYMVSPTFEFNYFCNGECLENCCGAKIAESMAAGQLFRLLIGKSYFCEISILIVVAPYWLAKCGCSRIEMRQICDF
jgi:hypothetical protein